MAPDLGGFLARYGAIVDGNGTHWSIGGRPRTGISGSHNVRSQEQPRSISETDQALELRDRLVPMQSRSEPVR